MIFRYKAIFMAVCCPVFLALLTTVFPGVGVCDPWVDMGLYGGQVTSLAVDPVMNSVLYAGTWGGNGLFMSSDNGTTWSALPSDDDPWFRNVAVFDISVDPNNTDNIWVANADYIDVSRDRGKTWESLDFASLETRLCFSVAVDPHDKSGKTVYAGTGGRGYHDRLGSVFKTTDGGETWHRTQLISDFDVYDIIVNPAVEGQLWAACNKYQISPYGQICRSDDGGDSWTKWNFDWYVDELIVLPDVSDQVFAGGASGVIRMNDNLQWEHLEPSTLCTAFCCTPGPVPRLYAGLDDSVGVTEDMGESWLYHESPGELLCMSSVYLHEKNILFGGHLNRGIFKSVDNARSWVESNRGIKANIIFSTDISLSICTQVAAASFAGVYLKSGSSAWKLINPECSEAVLFHPLDGNTIFAGCDWGIYKTMNSGGSWEHVPLFDTGDVYAVSSLAASKNSPETVFAGTYFYSGDRGSVFRSLDNGNTYNEVLQVPEPVNCVEIDILHPGVVYAGTGNFNVPVSAGDLYKSADYGNSWAKTTLQRVVVNSIYIAPEKPGLIYVGCGAYDYSYSGIFRSADGGETWEDISHGFPLKENISGLNRHSFAITDIAGNAEENNIVYAASYDQGIYMGVSSGDYWTRIGLTEDYIYSLDTSDQDCFSLKNVRRRIAASDNMSSIVFAGTSRGLLGMNTGGLGMISGSVVSAASGIGIDNAVVLSGSSSCLSVEGYYMLVAPAGVHTISISCNGYIPKSLSGIKLNGGENITQDILLQQSDDKNESCLITFLFPEDKDRRVIKTYKEFRNRVLKKTETGSCVIEEYYKKSRPVCTILKDWPVLREILMYSIKKAVPVINKIVESTGLQN